MMKRAIEGIRAISRSVSALTNPVVLVPLLLYLIIKIVITTLYLELPKEPFSRFWALLVPGLTSEDLLHYPYSLLNMGPVLSNLDHLLNIFVLVICEAATIFLIRASILNEKPKLVESLSLSMRSYFHLVLAAAFSSAIIYLSVKLPGLAVASIQASATSKAILASTIAALLIQPLIVYIIPHIVLGRKGIVQAIKASFTLGSSIYPQTLIIVVLSFLITAPVVFLELKSALLAFRMSPEFLIQLQLAGEIVEFLSLFILISGITVLFVESSKTMEENR